MKDELENGWAAYLSGVAGLDEVTILPMNSAEERPDRVTYIEVEAGEVDHEVGPLYLCDSLKVRVVTPLVLTDGESVEPIASRARYLAVKGLVSEAVLSGDPQALAEAVHEASGATVTGVYLRNHESSLQEGWSSETELTCGLELVDTVPESVGWSWAV